jgi:diguanylate cyclase (GGDEF)-like protein
MQHVGQKPLRPGASTDSQTEAAAQAGRPLHLPSFEERLKNLLAVPVLQMKIPADLREPFEQAIRSGERTLMVRIFAIVAALNAGETLFDPSMFPAPVIHRELMIRAFISGVFAAGAIILSRRSMFHWRHVILLVCGIVLLGGLSCCAVMYVGSSMTELVLLEAVLALTAMTMFLRIKASICGMICGVWLLILAIAVQYSRIQPFPIKIELVMFCGVILMMLTISRFMQYQYMFRMFITRTRDKIRHSAGDVINEKIADITYADQLTDVPNRRYFDELFETISQYISDAGQSLLPLSLCMIDLDHFAALNDAMGHERGDACLRAVASALRRHMRGRSDILARYGGDEFLLLLPGTDSTSARCVAARMHSAINRLALPNPGAPGGVLTASIGVFTVVTAGDTLTPLIKETEKAVAAAKTAGRNRVFADV